MADLNAPDPDEPPGRPGEAPAGCPVSMAAAAASVNGITAAQAMPIEAGAPEFEAMAAAYHPRLLLIRTIYLKMSPKRKNSVYVPKRAC